MAESFEEAMERAVRDAQALSEYLDGLGGEVHASPEAIGHAGALADRIEDAVARAEECYAESAANGAAYQALEGIDALRAAMRGNDVVLMRAVAREIVGHLARARDLSMHAGGGT